MSRKETFFIDLNITNKNNIFNDKTIGNLHGKTRVCHLLQRTMSYFLNSLIKKVKNIAFTLFLYNSGQNKQFLPYNVAPKFTAMLGIANHGKKSRRC